MQISSFVSLLQNGNHHLTISKFYLLSCFSKCGWDWHILCVSPNDIKTPLKPGRSLNSNRLIQKSLRNPIKTRLKLFSKTFHLQNPIETRLKVLSYFQKKCHLQNPIKARLKWIFESLDKKIKPKPGWNYFQKMPSAKLR